LTITESSLVTLFKSDTVIYCRGIFDLHNDLHYDFLQQASKYGTKLIVGIFDDETATSYSGTKPHLTYHIRAREVLKYKNVTEVIKNAPKKIDKEFIKQHSIDYVVIPWDDYSNDDLFKSYYDYVEQLDIGIEIAYSINDTNYTLINTIMDKESEYLVIDTVNKIKNNNKVNKIMNKNKTKTNYEANTDFNSFNNCVSNYISNISNDISNDISYNISDNISSNNDNDEGKIFI
jgi:glycerol-3-phosphate cytidylyltransferase-like family protein